MKYLKLYEDYEYNKYLIAINYRLIKQLMNYFERNRQKIKYYNGWKIEIFGNEFRWKKENLMLCDRFSNVMEDFYLATTLYNGEEMYNTWSKDIEIPKNSEERKIFFDEYFESKPNILYCAENVDKAIDFIKFLIETVGTKIKRVLALKINDTINGDFISYVTKYGVYFKREHYVLKQYPLEKLIKLYEYLKKKYPKMAVGNEWGFFDLKHQDTF